MLVRHECSTRKRPKHSHRSFAVSLLNLFKFLMRIEFSFSFNVQMVNCLAYQWKVPRFLLAHRFSYGASVLYFPFSFFEIFLLLWQSERFSLLSRIFFRYFVFKQTKIVNALAPRESIIEASSLRAREHACAATIIIHCLKIYR